MTTVAHTLSELTALGFLWLAVVSVRTWFRERTASSRYLALALAPIALVSVIGQVETIRPSTTTPLAPASIVAFQVSGYALLLFRGTLVPLGGRARLAAGTALILSGGFLGVVGSADAGTAPTSLQYAGAVAVILTWAGCVAEPTVRLWRVARRRPTVQRARLRAVSAGYASIAAILIVSIGPRSATTSGVAQVGFAIAGLALVPLLSVAFAPPVWIRRRWRRQEEASLGRGLQALFIAHSDRTALAKLGLTWALRLTGADAGLIIDGDGTVLASHHIPEATAGDAEATMAAVLADIAATRCGSTPEASRLQSDRIMATLAGGGAPGLLVVSAGPFTPLLGSDEVQLLERYAACLAIAMERLRLLDAMRASEAQSRQLLEGVEDYAFFTTTSLGTVTSWNAGAERLLGRSAATSLGLPVADVVSADAPETVETAVARARGGGRSDVRLSVLGHDGGRVPVDLIVARVDGVGVSSDQLAVMVHDVSVPAHAERLRAIQFAVSRILAGAASLDVAAPHLLEAIGSSLESALGFLWLVEPSSDRIVMKRAWYRDPQHASLASSLSGAVQAPGSIGFVGRAWTSGRPQAVADLATSPLDAGQDEAVAARFRSGLAIPILEGDRVLGVVWFVADHPRSLDDRLLDALGDVGSQIGQFVERARAQAELARIARTDWLTGLANRGEFERRLGGIATTPFAILAIDVDDLKLVNDTYGHEAGDEALRAIATALRMGVREADVVARTGGDEFAALLPGAGADEAGALAERLRTAMHAVTVAHGQAHISVGSATGEAGDNPTRVWSEADDALFRAKRGGRDRCEMASMVSGSSSRLTQTGWESILASILHEHAVIAVYQPVVDLRDGSMVGFEALGRPSPAQAGLEVEGLFAAAERLGEGRNLDWLCRRAAVHDAHPLPAGTLLFVNVSVSALLDPVHAVDQMMLLLRWARRRPDTVVLEITEREAVRDVTRLATVLAEYREQGFRFALDDVGAGHSTFEVLAAAVPEYVKVSERLTRRADQTGPRSVIRAVVQFAEDSGGDVIAEGLESEASIWLMRDLGVTHGQGYTLGRPAPAKHWGDRTTSVSAAPSAGPDPQLLRRQLG